MRALVTGIATLIGIALFGAALFFGLIAGVLLATAITGGHPASTVLWPCALLGFAAGFVVALLVARAVPRFVYALRVASLRRGGTRAMASVVELEERVSSTRRGVSNTRYGMHLRWTDPVSGAVHEHDRVYVVASPQGAPRHFQEEFDRGAKVPVLFHQHHPGRFVVDIPYRPALADMFL
ncbi:MAG TPA: hypothetical protein VIA06_12550 [Candidatus Dormibacteraeota bacterium]|nr:hypothetical protein [Candidatus Dormibacteraeota bacterium]